MKKLKCFKCFKEFAILGIGSHLTKCASEFDKTLRMIKIYEFNLNIKIDKKFMKSNYIQKGYSLPDFLEKFNFPYSFTESLIEYYGLKKRNIKQANSSKKRYQKFKKTCLDKYGVENISQLEETKEKKKNTFIKHYGVDNVRKSDEFKNWLNLYMLEKYGKRSVPNINGNMDVFGWRKLSQEEKEKRKIQINQKLKEYYKNISSEDRKIIAERLGKASKKFWRDISNEEKILRISNLLQTRYKNGPRSKLEILISNILDELHIPYTRYFNIKNKEFDFLINETNILLEINGDYWHANPDIYNSDDIIHYPKNRYIKASDIWEKDSLKKKIAENEGFLVLYVWEKDIKSNSQIWLQRELERVLNENFKNKENN